MKRTIAFLLAGVTAGTLVFAATASAAPQSFAPREGSAYYMTAGDRGGPGHDEKMEKKFGHDERDAEWFGKRMSKEEREEMRAEHRARREAMKKELMALPPEEREARMQEMRKEFEAKREERRAEFKKNFKEKWESSSPQERKEFCGRAAAPCNAAREDGGKHGGKRPGCEMIREHCAASKGRMND